MAGWLGKRAEVLLTLAVGLAGFFVYAATAAPSVMPGDAGEFQFVPAIAGIAHPTGYPLFVMLGHLWSRLPLGEVAYRMNLFSAVWGGVCVALVFALAASCVRTLAPEAPAFARRLLGALAAALLAVSPTFWSQATMAEVYTLHAAFVAGLLLLTLRVLNAEEHQAIRYLTALAWVFGLSLTHHSTTVLLAPALAAALVLSGRLRGMHLRSLAVAVLPGILIPLLLYAYIPLRAAATPYALLSLTPERPLVLYENTLRGFLDLVSGRAFGGQVVGGAVDGDRFRMALELLLQQFGGIGAGLAVLGIVGIAARRRWGLLALTGFAYVAVVAFNLAYFIGDVYVLFIPSYLIVAVWIALGVWTAADGVYRLIVNAKTSPVPPPLGGATDRRLVSAIRPLVVTPVTVLALALPLALVPAGLDAGDRSRQTDYARGWQSILSAPLPQGAVLVSNDRDEMMPMWYYQYVGGKRPDLLGLFPLIIRDPGVGDIGQVGDRALESGRAVFLVKPMPGLEVKYRLAAEGPVVRVLGPHIDNPAHPLDAAFGDSLRLTGYGLPGDALSGGSRLEVTLWWECRGPIGVDYSTYVHLIDGQGRVIAQEDHRPGGDYYPSRLWQPGDVLADRHVLSLPPDPVPGVYRLTAGVYEWPSLAPAGDEVSLQEMDLTSTVVEAASE